MLTAEKNPQVIGHRDHHQRQKLYRYKLSSDGEHKEDEDWSTGAVRMASGALVEEDT